MVKISMTKRYQPELSSWRDTIATSWPAHLSAAHEAQLKLQDARDLKAPAEGGIGSKLSKTFARWAHLSSSFKGYKAAKQTAQESRNEAYAATVDTFDPIIRSFLGNSPSARLFADCQNNVAQTASAMDFYKTALVKVDNVLAAIQTCHEQCEDAKGMEWADAFSNNGGINFLSHMETEEAKETIAELGERIKEFHDFSKAYPSIFPDRHKLGAGLAPKEFSFWLDIFEVGPFGSLGNIDKLNECLEALPELQGAAKGIRSTVMDYATNAYHEHRKAAKELDCLRANAITRIAPHLGLTADEAGMACDILIPHKAAPTRARSYRL